MWFKLPSLIRIHINVWSTFVKGRFRFRSSSAEMWLTFGSLLDHVWFNVGPALADTTSTRMRSNREPPMRPQSMNNQHRTKSEPNLNRHWSFVGPNLVQILLFAGCSLCFGFVQICGEVVPTKAECNLVKSNVGPSNARCSNHPARASAHPRAR